jgi:glycosyltransferase involved in cell wall biosynthesis
MNTIPLSVFIIAKNEADRIIHTLESVKDWVDEIIVVDSGSTDDTVKVSESYGAHVVFREWTGYGPQKVYGESLCRNKWILNLDGDEELTPELAAEIRALFAMGEPDVKGFYLRIMMLFPYETKLPRFGVGTNQRRLYHRDHAGFKSDYVHDTLIMKSGEKTAVLTHPVKHRCFRDHFHTIEKMNRFTGMQAEDMFRKNKHPSALQVIGTPLVAFIKAYFLRRYFVYGLDGFIQSVIYAFGRTLRLAKLRELNKRNTPEK